NWANRIRAAIGAVPTLEKWVNLGSKIIGFFMAGFDIFLLASVGLPWPAAMGVIILTVGGLIRITHLLMHSDQKLPRKHLWDSPISLIVALAALWMPLLIHWKILWEM